MRRLVRATRKPVVLKRGLSAKIEELLLAAEYLLAAGNDQVVLVEREMPDDVAAHRPAPGSGVGGGWERENDGD